MKKSDFGQAVIPLISVRFDWPNLGLMFGSSSETRPASFPSICLEARTQERDCFPFKICREGAEGFLFSVPYPHDGTRDKQRQMEKFRGWRNGG